MFVITMKNDMTDVGQVKPEFIDDLKIKRKGQHEINHSVFFYSNLIEQEGNKYYRNKAAKAFQYKLVENIIEKTGTEK